MPEFVNLSSRESAHVQGEVPHVSKDPIVVVGGAFASGTVLGKKADGTYTQLDPGATEEKVAEAILFGHVDATDGPVNADAHTRVSSFFADRIVWPAGISPAQQEAAIDELAAKNMILR